MFIQRILYGPKYYHNAISRCKVAFGRCGAVWASNEIHRPVSVARGASEGTGRRDRSTSFSLFHLMLTAPSF